MKKEKDGKVVSDEENSSQENKEHVAPSQNTGLSRREVLKKAVWMVPVILSAQLSRKAFADEVLSCKVPGDNCTCTAAGDDTFSRCDIKQCDNLADDAVVCGETGCPSNCDWCDGSWWDLCNPYF